MFRFVKKLFDYNEKELKRLSKIVEQINSFEPKISNLSDKKLQKKTVEFRNRLSEGASLEEMLPEAFAVVREAAKRTVQMRPYDVQMIAAIALFEGKIAEQKTGEGKTQLCTCELWKEKVLI
jgi:preprotein translocase subunit SecA